MPSTAENNKRIAKNTAMLYIRMLLIMAVTLYTSRVVLEVLGVEDFGIYNIVGGVVVLFSFINNAMATATQRFLNFALGRNDIKEVGRVFSMSMTAHISIALLVLLLAETIGLWFLLTQMNIPEGRMGAAIWCYQFSILTTCIQIIRVPYNACIIAYERMSFYAYISILEVILKLLIVFLLSIGGFDKLILYSILIFLVTWIICYVYKIVCNRNFEISRYSFFWDKTLYKKLMSFSGWSLFGSAANVGVQQGINILLNIFYGVALNTAVGISNQVTHALYSFVSNFQIAFNPSLVKNYAAQNYSLLKKMIFVSSKFSFFLYFIISMPMFLYTDFFLSIWLKDVPAYASEFTKLMILFLALDTLAAPFWITVQASGNIRKYQIVVSSLLLLNIPISYVFLFLGGEPKIVFSVSIVINAIVFVYRIYYVHLLLSVSLKEYFCDVLLRILLIIVFSVFVLFVLKQLSLVVWYSLLIVLSQTFLLIYGFGLSKEEKNIVWKYVKVKFKP